MTTKTTVQPIVLLNENSKIIVGATYQLCNFGNDKKEYGLVTGDKIHTLVDGKWIPIEYNEESKAWHKKEALEN